MVDCRKYFTISCFDICYKLNRSCTPDQTAKFSSKTDKSIFSKLNVLRAISKKLDTHKSAVPDGFHPLVIKSCSQSFVKALSLIFQTSFETGIVPEMWKIANISPIFKKGLKSDPANYRPISLTAVPCKIMDRMVRDEMMAHLMV